MKTKCPYCKSDELKPYKDFYCCYGCGKIVKNIQFNIRLDINLKERVLTYCKEHNTKIAKVIHEALIIFLLYKTKKP